MKECANCYFGEKCNVKEGYTHCRIYDASFTDDSRCTKYEKEDNVHKKQQTLF